MPVHLPLVLACAMSLLSGSGCRAALPEPASVSPPSDPRPTSEDAPGPIDAESSAPETPTETPPAPMVLTLYFPHGDGIANTSCDAVLPVTRELTPEPDIPSLAVRLLLEGPTTEEKERHGVIDSFEHGRFDHTPDLEDLSSYFARVIVRYEQAFVDFDDRMALEYITNDAACGRMTVTTAIERTLGALPGIRSVRYRVEGQLVDDEGGA